MLLLKSIQKTLLPVLLLLLSAPVIAAVEEVPKGVKLVTAPEVRHMLADDKTLVAHVLSRIEYQMQHIPGSINIPVDEIGTSDKMPKDRGVPIVFYCNGLACPYSRRASIAAVKSGYTNIHWFRGGILEWRKYRYAMKVNKQMQSRKVVKLSPQSFLNKVTPEVLIVDVRPRWWRQSREHSGVIEGTNMRIPLLELDRRLHLLPKGRPILLVDRLMRQSVHAAKYLLINDYKVIGVLKGGTKRWVAEGLPVLQQPDEPAISGD